MKNKTIKCQLNEESASIPEEIANELPRKVSPAASNKLLPIQDLIYLRYKANQCILNFQNRTPKKMHDIREEYPAYIFK